MDVEDHEDRLALCAVCETHPIRFVHVMEHPDFDGQLRVGGDCAGFTADDSEEAPRRNNEFRNYCSRRGGWIGRRWPGVLLIAGGGQGAWREGRKDRTYSRAADGAGNSYSTRQSRADLERDNGWCLWQPHNANWKLHARGMKQIVFSNRGWGALVEIDSDGLEAEFLPRQSSVCRAKFAACKWALELEMENMSG